MFARMVVCLALITALASNGARSDEYPFAGFFVSGVTPDGIDPIRFQNTCMIAPYYHNARGEAYFFRLDLPYYRQTQKLRYRMKPVGYHLIYDREYKVIAFIPTEEKVKSYDGNPYFAPKAEYRLVTSSDPSVYTYLAYRSVKSLNKALATGDHKYGNRGAMKRCPMSDKDYLRLAVDDSTLPPLSEAESKENYRVLVEYGDRFLLQGIAEAFAKLQ